MKEKKNRGSFQGALYLNNGISRKNKKTYIGEEIIINEIIKENLQN